MLLPGEAGVCLASVSLRPRTPPWPAPASGPSNAGAGFAPAMSALEDLAREGGMFAAANEEEMQFKAQGADMTRLVVNVQTLIREMHAEASQALAMVPSAPAVSQLPKALLAMAFALDRLKRARALLLVGERQEDKYAGWCAAAFGDWLLGSRDGQELQEALSRRRRAATLARAAGHAMASHALPALAVAHAALVAQRVASLEMDSLLSQRSAQVSRALAALPAQARDAVNARVRMLRVALAAATPAISTGAWLRTQLRPERMLDEVDDALRPGAGTVGARQPANCLPSRTLPGYRVLLICLQEAAVVPRAGLWGARGCERRRFELLFKCS